MHSKLRRAVLERLIVFGVLWGAAIGAVVALAWVIWG